MRALVTGGGGFLGERMVELLVEGGHEVSILARSQYPHIQALGVRGIQADLQDKEAVRKAVAGHDTVFHVASLAGYWARPKDPTYWRINVDGTRNILDACESEGVAKLVYTGTPSVVGYACSICNGAQDLPYANPHESPYPLTKAVAETEVLRANGRHLATVSLRPHCIFGPRDRHLFTQIVERQMAGKFFVVGDGQNKIDITYIDNAAWAHLDAAEALTDHEAACAGKAYFIGNEDPPVIYDWLNEVFAGLGLPPVTRRIPLGVARPAAGALKVLWDHLPLKGEPRITPYLTDALAKDHWYDPEPARRDLGYRIRVDMEEGTQRTIAWMRDHFQLSE